MLLLLRFVFVLDGLLTAAEGAAGSARRLHAGDFAYIPPDSAVRFATKPLLHTVFVQAHATRSL